MDEREEADAEGGKKIIIDMNIKMLYLEKSNAP